MPLYPYSVYQNPKFYRKRLNQTCPEYFWSQFLCPKVDYQFLIPSNSDWDFTYFKRFNNCYILLLNSLHIPPYIHRGIASIFSCQLSPLLNIYAVSLNAAYIYHLFSCVQLTMQADRQVKQLIMSPKALDGCYRPSEVVLAAGCRLYSCLP